MVNKLWILFVALGVIFSILNGRTDNLSNVILNSTKTSFEMIVKIFPVMSLWLGIMKIAEKSGLLTKVSLKLYPILKFLFPELKKDDEAFSLIASNVVANFFGLGNAATPLGIKAMECLQERNTKKDTASRSMITFIILNTSGFTIIPTTIIALRMYHNSINPSSIVLACFITSFLSVICGLLIDRLFARRNHD